MIRLKSPTFNRSPTWHIPPHQIFSTLLELIPQFRFPFKPPLAVAVPYYQTPVDRNAGKKGDMATKTPKKANLLDHYSIKHILDESVNEIVTSREYVEDVKVSNMRLLMGTIIIIIALMAQFYKNKFPENREFLIGCIILYDEYLEL